MFSNLSLEQFSILALFIIVVVPGALLIWLFLFLMNKWRISAEKARLEDEERLKVLSQKYNGQSVFLCESVYRLTDPSPESVTELIGQVVSNISDSAQGAPDIGACLDFYDGYEIYGMPTIPIKPGMQLTIQGKPCLIRQIHFTEDNLDGTDNEGPIEKSYPVIIQAPGIDLKIFEEEVNQNIDDPTVIPIATTIITAEAFEEANLPK